MATLPVNETLVKSPPRPFYRTKRGIIIIIVVVVAIVSAIVGGVVGGLTSTSLSQPNGVATAQNGVDSATTTLTPATVAPSFLTTVTSSGATYQTYPTPAGSTYQTYPTPAGSITLPPSVPAVSAVSISSL